MYDRLEELRDYIIDLEIDENYKSYMLSIIADIERDIEIQEGAIEYLSDEDNFE